MKVRVAPFINRSMECVMQKMFLKIVSVVLIACSLGACGVNGHHTEVSRTTVNRPAPYSGVSQQGTLQGIQRLSINANGTQLSARQQCLAEGKRIVDDKCKTPDANGRYECTKKCI